MLLVILRLAIGWHFYKEGVSHHTDPAWSSEGFLRQAKGPFAGIAQSILPSFHGWNRLILAPTSGDGSSQADAAKSESKPKADAEPNDKAAKKPAEASEKKPADKKDTDKKASDKKSADAKSKAKKATTTESPTYEAWLDAATADWKADAKKYADYYGFDEMQEAKAKELVEEANARMKEHLEDYDHDIRLYRELVARAQAMPSAPGGRQIPNEVTRSAAARQNPLGERGISGPASPLYTMPAAWLANAKAVDQLFHDELRGLLTDDQREMPVPTPSDATWLHRIDFFIPWTLMVVGGLLIVGLFTRLAAVVGALFLLSVICLQPPWLATSMQTYTYNQMVEMLALLALATTPVGRWCGLDYFLGLCCRGCCGSRSKADAQGSNLPPGVSMPPGLKKRLN